MNEYIKIEIKELIEWHGKGPDGCIVFLTADGVSQQAMKMMNI